MNEYLAKVKEFHEKFEHPINESDKDISLRLRVTRLNLLFEELKELAESLDIKSSFADLCVKSLTEFEGSEDGDNIDREGVLDALCDLQVVLSGAAISLGHYKHMDEAFDEVHESNMSKMCNDMKEVKESIEWYENERNQHGVTYLKKDGKYILRRIEDDKILKNKYYKPANLDKFIK